MTGWANAVEKVSLSMRKMNTRKILSKSILVIVLVAGLVTLLTYLPGPGSETTGPVEFQAVEHTNTKPNTGPNTGPVLQNSIRQLPPGGQTKLEAAFIPDTEAKTGPTGPSRCLREDRAV